MAIQIAPEERLGYFEVGLEDAFPVPPVVEARFRGSPDYFKQFRSLLGIEVDQVSKSNEALVKPNGTILRVDPLVVEEGAIYSTLIEAKLVNHSRGFAVYSLIDQPGEVLQAKKHYLRGPDTTHLRHGILPHAMTGKDYSLVMSVMRVNAD